MAAIRRVGAFSLAEAVVAWGTPDGDLLTAGPFNKEGSSTLMALLKGANYTEIPSEELPSPLRTGSNIDAYNAAWKTQRSE